MEGEFNRESFEPIYRMLFEMAKGNFDFQLERIKYHDELGGLKLLMNLTAQKLKRNRNHFLWLNKDREFVKIQTASFLLNSESKIIHFQSEMDYFRSKAERWLQSEIIFSDLLTKKSKDQWNSIIKSFKRNKITIQNIPLNYSFYKAMNLRLQSVIAQITCGNAVYYIINSSQLNLEKDKFFNTPEIKSNHTLSIWDQQLFQDIHSYIINHLEQPLISNPDLASLFNTNENKIKMGFKEAYGITPFQLHREKRIEHCKILIMNTDLSFSEIAQKMGFSSYPQFSRTFKMVTEKSPRTYKKRFCS